MDTLLHFSSPECLTKFFTVLPDRTPWDGRYTRDVQDEAKAKNDGPGSKKSTVVTPIRERATFRTTGRGLDSTGKSPLPHSHGIYVLAFKKPEPAIYIGIAANGGMAPEGIVVRIKKHRVKATGSHVANEPGAGGIHHPEEWSKFVLKRHMWMQGSGEPDMLGDVIVMTGTIGDGQNAKDICEYYEGRLTRSGILRDRLIHEVFGSIEGSVCPLNRTNSGGRRPQQAGVIFGADGMFPLN